MSKEDDLSAEVVPYDRADSHAMHGSAIMIMASLGGAKVLREEQTRGPAGRRTEHFLKNPRGQLPAHHTSPCHCRRRFAMAFPMRRPAGPRRLTFYADGPRCRSPSTQ